MRKKLFPLFLALILPLALNLKAADKSQGEDIVIQNGGNKLYKEGKFYQALKVYRQDNINRPDNPHTLYNMGNCYFRLNSMGRAVLYYCKAFNLLPRDSHIRHNLKFALKQTGQKLVPDGVPLFLHKAFFFLSLNELKSISYILFWILCLILIGIIFKKDLAPGLKNPLVYSAVLFGLFFIWSAMRSNSSFEKAAVIIEADTPILSGPGENFKTYAAAPEGRIVKISDTLDSKYIEIGLPEKGIKGWVKRTDIERI